MIRAGTTCTVLYMHSVQLHDQSRYNMYCTVYAFSRIVYCPVWTIKRRVDPDIYCYKDNPFSSCCSGIIHHVRLLLKKKNVTFLQLLPIFIPKSKLDFIFLNFRMGIRILKYRWDTRPDLQLRWVRGRDIPPTSSHLDTRRYQDTDFSHVTHFMGVYRIGRQSSFSSLILYIFCN